jgi:OOP family OmpA-OmpF porin
LVTLLANNQGASAPSTFIGQQMNRIVIVTLLLATTNALAQSNVNDNWMANGKAVRTSTNDCIRNGFWTPATAAPECAPDLKPQARPAAQPQVKVAPPVQSVAPNIPPPPPTVVPAKVTLQADTLFDFDKSVLKPEGRARLTKFVQDTTGIKYTVVVVTGHTDSVGTDEYNMRLGLRRAESVKAYLVSQGVAANQIQTASRGKREPVADNRTAAGRALNRRVIIEITGTK